MKRSMRALAACGFLAAIVAATTAEEPATTSPQTATNVQLLMQDKLKYANAALEGIVLEDFDKVASSAEWLRMISRAASWQAVRTDEYNHYSEQFRRAAEQMRDGAKQQNVDATTLHYTRMTMACVDCHRYLRDYFAKRAEESSP